MSNMHVRKVCEVIAPGPSTRSIREKDGAKFACIWET